MTTPSKHRQGSRGRIRLKRAYAAAERADGLRVLVDRLWPRGLAKEQAKIDLWLKEIAPSDDLRRWFGHAPGRWEEFARKYRDELRERPELRHTLDTALERGAVTLLFAARDEARNNAVVLKAVLERE